MSSAYATIEVGGRAMALLRGRAHDDRSLAAPILLVHGAGGAARNFFSLLRHLPRNAVAIDMPGHGHSAGAGPGSIDEAAALILEAAGELFPGERPVLAGHSLGAAQTLRAVVVSGGETVGGYAAIAAGARLTLGTELAPIARQSFAGFLQRLERAGTSALTLDQLRATGQETVVSDLDMASGHALAPDARRWSGPALVLAGGADAIAPPELCLELSRALKGSRLIVTDGASHLLMVDRPAEVAADLCWLAARAEAASSG